jgi:hypothetical protein
VQARAARRARAAHGHLVLSHLALNDLVLNPHSLEVAMPITSRYLFTASMDVEPAKEALFNEVYDREHVPTILKVPGVVSALRFKRRPLEMIIGGERKTIVIEGEPSYTALYELESPSVLVSPEFAKAVELGRWPAEVRPFTKTRKHFMWERI